MNIEFIEAVVVDETGGGVTVYRARYPETWAAEDGQIRDTEGTVGGSLPLKIVRSAYLRLNGLEDIESAGVLVDAILARMKAFGWPPEASPESLLYAVVNEALHELKKTAADFLLTDESPADTL
uniref:Uncharacterized protein n=1 Tax=Desulfomonile tiedjei TaxID=2358 RepID=A0A7C4EXW7_9BACT